MKKWVIAALFLLFGGSTLAQQFQITRSVALGNHVGYLCWNSLPTATQYRLFRRFPNSNFAQIAALADTVYFDTLARTLCGDTVTYYVEAQLPDTFPITPSSGIFFQDNVPTSPCALRTCSVDTALRQVLLSWYPSPDTDILGYYICRDYPCMDYDTAWGRLNTRFLCPEELDPLAIQQHRFRVLAFDSCFQASPLTPYYSFPIIQSEMIDCDYRHFVVRWQPYYNMPDSVGSYRLFYRLAGDTALRCHTVAGGSQALVFDTLVDNLVVSSIYCYLRVDSRNDSLHAFSLPMTFALGRADTASYVSITSLQYDDAVPAVTLTFAIDTAFVGDGTCIVERRRISDTLFTRLATLSRTDCAAEQRYVDADIAYTAGGYVYRVGVPDNCGQQVKYSDTAQLLLPPVEDATGFFSNVLVAGKEGLDRFCPILLSPLARDYSLDIYNRFGCLCFHSDTLGECWDGTDRSGHQLPQGTYVYLIRCRHADGTDKTYHGSILLLR